MILFPLIALSCFVASSLAADNSSRAAPDEDKPSPNNRLDSLQILSIKSLKPVLGVLPKFLVTCKSWSTERAWAYSLGLSLGMKKDMLTQTSTKDNAKILKIHPAKVCESLCDLGATVWKPNENSLAISVEKDIFPRLFNMELVRTKLASLNETISLKKFRELFAPCLISTEGMITVDVAILNWLDQEIQDTSGNEPLKIDPYVLEPLCALSLYPHVEAYCTDNIMRVIGSLNWSTNSDTEEKFFFSFLSIIKQLDPCPIRTAIEELAARTFKDIFMPSSQFPVLDSRVRLGHGHEFLNLLETSVSVKELHLESAFYQKIVKTLRAFSMSDARNMDLSRSDRFDILFFAKQYLHCANFSEGKLKWEQTARERTTWHIRLQPLPVNTSIGAVGTNLESRLVISSRFKLPATIWNEIKSCTDFEQLQILMRPLCLTYRMTFLVEPTVFKVTY